MAEPEVVLEARNVFKKFKKGEMYHSLRDLIPALVGRGLRGNGESLDAREFWALRDVSFQVRRGEAFGVIGHNGAGKSTLLKHLSGIMKPTTGTLTVKGRLSALIEVGAGFHPDLTGRENIYLNGTILGMSREEIGRKFDAIVEFSGLEEFIDTPIKRFSSGMFARLGFSVAVHVEPDVLVVDEVLSVGDYLFQKRGVDKMKAVLTGGTTVVFVSHNLRAVSGLCHRAMLMERGGVLAIGETSDVIRKYMERGSQAAHENTDKDAYVARVTLRSDAAEAIQFEAGAKMYADVEIVARRRVEKVAVVIECQNDEHYEVFNTSSQRLGVEPINLEAGEKFLETFELTLHLVPGTYHVGVYLHRYDIDQTYDSLVPAATFYVGSQSDVRGVAHLEPRVVQHEKRSGST